MSYTIKPFEDLDIMDDFLMNAIANDEEVNEEFFRTLLSGLLQRKIGRIKVSAQRVIPAVCPDMRGIRLDVEISEYDISETDEWDVDLRAKTIYDVEPHRKDSIDLPKHNRFYQAKIDSRNMKSGEKDFVKLPNLFVITITNYDPFGYDYMVYTVFNRCEEIPELEYKDGLKFIYFNTTGTKGGNSTIKKLLNYVQDSKIKNVTDEATQKLHDVVSRVRISPEARLEYMTWEEKIFYERLEAKEEGRKEGELYQLCKLVSKSIVPLEVALEETNLSREGFIEKMKVYGFEIDR